MGVPSSEVGYNPAMPRREEHEDHKGHVVALGGGMSTVSVRDKWNLIYLMSSSMKVKKKPVPLTSLWTKSWDVRKILKAYHRMAIIGFYLGTNKQQLMTRPFLNSGSCHLVTSDANYKDTVNKSLQYCPLEQCFSTVGSRPGTGPWHQLYRAARGSAGIYN